METGSLDHALGRQLLALENEQGDYDHLLS